MPRAHRHFLPNHIWHITHRCHKKEYLLKFAKDRRCWLRWLTEARKRYGLCVLNYIVTSNHVHLLVYDRGRSEIVRSMQLVAGRTAQEYNRRKQRKGAFWEDRYHATAVDTDDYLVRCMVYIDLNMVRAGVVNHPAEWPASGYREIQQPPKRYRIINLPALMELLGISQLAELQRAHEGWVDEALGWGGLVRHGIWTESLAVGSQAFVARMKGNLGIGARYRKLLVAGDTCYLKEEPVAAYNAHSRVQKRTLNT
jgi:putative transposase